jgi:hypothetical protein
MVIKGRGHLILKSIFNYYFKIEGELAISKEIIHLV